MPRKRRRVKARIPEALSDISLTERTLWRCVGPILAADGVRLGPAAGLYHVWPSWDAWAQFYGAVREDLYRDRPWRRDGSAAERLYAAYLQGGDLDAVRDELAETARRDDPRRRLFG